MDRAKVFMTGRSQAVRIPKAYRFDTDEVLIERTQGGVLLKPAPKLPLGDRLWLALKDLPDDPSFVRPEQPPLVRDNAWWDAHGFGAPIGARGKRDPATNKARAGARPPKGSVKKAR